MGNTKGYREKLTETHIKRRTNANQRADSKKNNFVNLLYPRYKVLLEEFEASYALRIKIVKSNTTELKNIKDSYLLSFLLASSQLS